MHSHLIPGIDDGAKTMSEAIEMIHKLVALGFQKIITTPHIMGEHYPNTPEKIEAGLVALKSELLKEKITIEIEVAAEYFIDDYFENLLNNNTRLLTFGDNHLLVELSTFSAPANIHEFIFQLKAKGYKPILAHPERYLYYADQLEQFEKMKAMGCLFQVNLLSLAGHYGKKQKNLGIQLLRSGWVDYLGTDTHRIQHLDRIVTVFQDRKVAKYLKSIRFKNANL